MLKPKKKISKRELKQDSLLTTYMQVTGFYDQYKKQISIGITAFVVVVVALVIFLKKPGGQQRAGAHASWPRSPCGV